MTRRKESEDYFLKQVKAYERAIMLQKKHKRHDDTTNLPRWPTMAHKIDPRVLAEVKRRGYNP